MAGRRQFSSCTKTPPPAGLTNDDSLSEQTPSPVSPPAERTDSDEAPSSEDEGLEKDSDEEQHEQEVEDQDEAEHPPKKEKEPPNQELLSGDAGEGLSRKRKKPTNDDKDDDDDDTDDDDEMVEARSGFLKEEILLWEEAMMKIAKEKYQWSEELSRLSIASIDQSTRDSLVNKWIEGKAVLDKAVNNVTRVENRFLNLLL